MAFDGGGEVRISTAAFAAADRTEAFGELMGRAILRFSMDPLPDHALQSEMTLRRLPGIGMASGFGSPMVNRHTPELIDNDDIVLSFIQSGTATHVQFGREAEGKAGDVVLTDNGEPATFTLQTRTQVINLRFARDRIDPYLANIGKSLSTPILREGPALSLLKSYTHTLFEGAALATPDLQHLVATHLFDLAALSLGATQDAAMLAKGRGVRAARLMAIKTAIRDELTNNRLSLDMIARKQGISARYIRQLFADEGTSFTEFVLDQRLALARRLLTGERLFHRPISAIAFDAGFGDLSYFNHAFRRRYGATPSDVRKAASEG